MATSLKKSEFERLENAILAQGERHDIVLQQQAKSLDNLATQIQESNKIQVKLLIDNSANSQKFLNITNQILELQKNHSHLTEQLAGTNKKAGDLNARIAVNSFRGNSLLKIYIACGSAIILAVSVASTTV